MAAGGTENGLKPFNSDESLFASNVARSLEELVGQGVSEVSPVPKTLFIEEIPHWDPSRKLLGGFWEGVGDVWERRIWDHLMSIHKLLSITFARQVDVHLASHSYVKPALEILPSSSI